MVQSTEASNAIEGIVTTNARLRQLVAEKTTPKDRDEQEIAGYRDALNIIHENHDAIPITQNYILQLHKLLYSHMDNPLAGRTKNVQNYISVAYADGRVETLFTPLAPYETPEALDRICEEYNRVIGNMELEPLIAIPVFIHDFLCIHPFNDGNGRMSRLLTTLLLYKSGIHRGQIHLPRGEDRQRQGPVLRRARPLAGRVACGQGKRRPPSLNTSSAPSSPLTGDLDERLCLVEAKLSALEMVRRASLLKLGRFTKQDIRELCPSLSDSSIEGAFRHLVASGELQREGRGKSTRYFRTN